MATIVLPAAGPRNMLDDRTGVALVCEGFAQRAGRDRRLLDYFGRDGGAEHGEPVGAAFF